MVSDDWFVNNLQNQIINISIQVRLMNHSLKARCRAEQGFTLLEMLVVLLIIALLVGYVGPRYFAQVDRARVGEAQQQMKGMADAMELFRLDVGRYPSPEEGLQALIVKPPDLASWQGPYLARAIPSDPWGRPYQLRSLDNNGAIEIFSLGKNGKAGDKGSDGELVLDL
jgi:general secretion pathway protein G